MSKAIGPIQLDRHLSLMHTSGTSYAWRGTGAHIAMLRSPSWMVPKSLGHLSSGARIGGYAHPRATKLYVCRWKGWTMR